MTRVVFCALDSHPADHPADRRMRRLDIRLRPPTGSEVNYLTLNLLVTLTLWSIKVENMSKSG